MSGNFGLYRRPSGIYVVRIAVPLRHRGTVGRGEIHVTTHLRETNAAKLAGLRIQIGWLEHFMELDAGKLASAEPLLHGQGLVSVEEAARLLGVSTATLLTELFNGKCSLSAYAEEWPCWLVGDRHKITNEPDGSYLMNDIERLGVQQVFSGEVQPLDSAAAINQLIATGSYSGDIFLHGKRGAVFCDRKQGISISAVLALKGDVQAIRSRLVKQVVSKPTTSARVAEPKSTDPINVRHGSKRFSELFAMLKDDRQWGDDNTRRMTTEASLFIELMGDPLLGDIEKETILEFAKRLRQLPSNIYQSRRKFKVTGLLDLIPLAHKHGLELKNEPTVKRHVGKLSEILNYGLSAGMLRFNPATDFKRGHRNTDPRREQDERQVFSNEDLKTIFSAEWFTTGAGTVTTNGRASWQPFHYWLPLLGLLTGARLNELSQLSLNDIQQSKGGVWYFDFNIDQPDVGEVQDKSLKTINAVRVVPVHKRLIELGLIEYVTALRRMQRTKLFPELRWDKFKGYGKHAGKWFNEYFLGKQLGFDRNGMKTFHSFRHGMLTALQRQGNDERTIKQLAGHERGSSITARRYIKDRTADDELQAVINALEFPCLNAVAPFSVPVALKAIRCSAKRKASTTSRSQ